jgi:hypothetical protein
MDHQFAYELRKNAIQEGENTSMDSSDEGDPGPDSSFKLVTKSLFLKNLLLLKLFRQKQPYEYLDKKGNSIIGKNWRYSC